MFFKRQMVFFPFFFLGLTVLERLYLSKIILSQVTCWILEWVAVAFLSDIRISFYSASFHHFRGHFFLYMYVFIILLTPSFMISVSIHYKYLNHSIFYFLYTVNSFWVKRWYLLFFMYFKLNRYFVQNLITRTQNLLHRKLTKYTKPLKYTL